MNLIQKRLFGTDDWFWIITSHYIEEEGKHPITSEEYKWIDYIHKEVIPSVQLYNSSSLGNLKYANTLFCKLKTFIQFHV